MVERLGLYKPLIVKAFALQSEGMASKFDACNKVVLGQVLAFVRCWYGKFFFVHWRFAQKVAASALPAATYMTWRRLPVRPASE